MQILTHSPYLMPMGGIEVSTVQDAVALSHRGHKIDLLYEYDGPLRKVYEEAGIRLHGPYSFGFDLKRTPRDLLRFIPSATWVRSHRPGVMWLNRFEHIIWAQTVAQIARCPIVCQLHHKPNFRWTRLMGRGVEHFIAVSEFMRRSWVEEGLDPDRISVIHNAVDPDDYPFGGETERSQARSSLNIDDDVSVVLYYGRIVPEKGVLTLLKAWEQLGLHETEGQLLLVGSPDLGSQGVVASALADMPAASGVRYYPEQLDVVPFLHASDVVVFPSHLKEAFGRVVIEGMSTGRPVIASRVGAVPEILRDSMQEFLYDDQSVEELRRLVSLHLDWRTTRPELGRECANFVGENFAYTSHLVTLENVLTAYGLT